MFRPQYLTINNIVSYEHSIYAFKEGKTTLIVGDNQDDSSQQGNGSGKSGLLEAIYLAITGNSIRDVSKKELVRDGCDSGSVTLSLSNSRTKQDVEITRIIYANTKPNEYRLLINGTDQRDKYSDANMFNAHVFKTLGISKEDFEAFYLITSVNYDPFLKIGDSKKKDIVNRFSGANKTDAVTPLIEADIKAEQVKKQTHQDAITAQRAKIDVYQEELDEEESVEPFNYTEEADKLQKEIEGLKVKADDIQKEYDQLHIDWGNANFEVQMFHEKNYDNLIAEVEKEKKELDVQVKGLEAELLTIKNEKRFKDEADSIKADETENKNNLEEFRNERNQFIALRDEINNQLAGLINCPKCKHEFTLQDDGFDPEEARQVLATLNDEEIPTADEGIAFLLKQQKEYPIRKTALQNKIAEAEKVQREKIAELRKQILDKTTTIDQYKADKRKQELELKGLKDIVVSIEKRKELKLKEAEEAMKLYQTQVAQMEIGLDQMADEHGPDKKKIAELKKKITDAQKIVDENEVKLQTSITEIMRLEQWLINFKNFKSHLANKSIKNITDYTNMYLQAMGSNISINIEGYRMLASSKKLKEEITTKVLRNGFDAGSYGKFSAGERGRIDISVILALQELINLNSPTGGLDLLICDEILDSVDSYGLESIIKALESVEKTILIVSQNSINSLADQTLTVRKKNKISTLCGCGYL